LNTFVKRRTDVPADFFAAEARGLEWLRHANAVRVPRVLDVTETSIVLERVDRGPWTHASDEQLGHRLAQLHRAGAPRFGADHDGYIGDLPLPNETADDWFVFYASQRIEPYVRMALGRRALPSDATRVFDRVCARLTEVGGPPEPPARIHGDLWRGNALADAGGAPWLVDPAAHGGHRETDLAMMRLFGGFGAACFAAYDDAFPLADGHEERVALHQLHPLLVHAALFGGGYGDQAMAAARRYV